ncbi:MAG: threonine--tRNA ligase [Deltaproteobacteria bacterium]|nr:threonine--tRNA ligase [Deltaproteobacteria bacterium]
MSAQINITLPDGSQRQYDSGTTIKDIAASIGKRLARDAVGGVIDGGVIVDIFTPLKQDAKLEIITIGSEKGLEVLRHSTAHLMASVVQQLFPGTQVTIGPSIENGFYYDFKRDEGFTPEDLEKIEDEMRNIAAKGEPFIREEVTREKAKQIFSNLGETFKLELLDAIPEGEPVSLYRHGEWVDLCRGPHVPSTALLKAFKLTHISGAYWRGDERNPMLARIYGTAFWDQKTLDAYLHQLEEAKKRDHRRLGKDLDLFMFHSLAPAMPFFTAKGAFIYNQLVNFIRRYYDVIGMDEVITPQVVDVELFRQSGHLANYSENMFFSQFDEREYGVKPMNCPCHCLMFADRKRSYRDLPIRMADFGRIHRYERSGVTAGLTRVRSFAQDDAHIFCREDQILDEIRQQVVMIKDVFLHFGLEMKVFLSTRPEKSLGNEPELSADERASWDQIWQHAEKTLEKALQVAGLQYTLNAGDGAFYGPKLDFQVRDAIGRWHQLSTIQLDYGLPRRFNLAYTNEQSSDSRPVMIHRAILGSLERFIGILIEHTAGDFPVWLAPEQVRVLTVNDELLSYGREVVTALRERGVRVSLKERNEKLGFKIREAELAKIPFVMVLGNKEMQARAVSLRWRKKGDQGQMPLDQAISLVLKAAALPPITNELLCR